jgi:hypothetical protein
MVVFFFGVVLSQAGSSRSELIIQCTNVIVCLLCESLHVTFVHCGCIWFCFSGFLYIVFRRNMITSTDNLRWRSLRTALRVLVGGRLDNERLCWFGFRWLISVKL